MSRRTPHLANAGKAEGSMPSPVRNPKTTAKDAGPSTLGNAATASLFGEGRALPSALRARLERSFGKDLSKIRVDDSSAARSKTDSAQAQAMVRDGTVHWGSSAPRIESPEAAPLLAHEVAHVIQQQGASRIEDRVSSPGEASETQAKTAAGQTMAGQTAPMRSGGAVAATQRQPNLDSTEKADGPLIDDLALEPIVNFLNKVAHTTPPQDIKKAIVVRDALKKLAWSGGPTAALVDVDKFVEAASTSSDPAAMARQFVQLVPSINKAALKSLDKQKFIDDQPSTVSRVKGLVDRSAPGKGNQPVEPDYKSPEKKAEELQKNVAAQTHTQPVTTHIASVDIFQVGRFLQGIKPALKPKATKAAAPDAEVYPSVTAAIAKMPAGVLVPQEARGKNEDDNWAGTKDFAESLAREMDLGQKAKQDTVTVDLGESYAGVKDRGVLRDAVEAIIQQLRDALPHHAADVKYVIVKTGKTTLTRGMVVTPNP